MRHLRVALNAADGFVARWPRDARRVKDGSQPSERKNGKDDFINRSVEIGPKSQER